MASFNRDFSTSSPVIGVRPQPAHHFPVHHYPYDRPILSHHQSLQFSHSGPSPQRPMLRSNSTFAGRKRSRDEAAANLDEPEKVVPIPTVEEAEDEWEYGPGMILIKKKSSYVIDAGSQSGTWLEEKAAEEHTRKTEAAILAQEQLSQDRPSLRSNKAQRLDMTATVTTSQATQASRSSPGRDVSDPDAKAQPIVDNFTLHLGVGWSQISTDEHIQAAARGWARYIENHFPVSDAKIRLESRGLQSYLVEATEGFFLFAENLRQGRLVSKNPERAFQNLKSTPPIFDGAETMTAAESPKPENEVAMHATPQHQKAAIAEVDMDMN